MENSAESWRNQKNEEKGFMPVYIADCPGIGEMVVAIVMKRRIRTRHRRRRRNRRRRRRRRRNRTRRTRIRK